MPRRANDEPMKATCTITRMSFEEAAASPDVTIRVMAMRQREFWEWLYQGIEKSADPDKETAA